LKKLRVYFIALHGTMLNKTFSKAHAASTGNKKGPA
jgi:hypothetical protein